MSATGRAPQPAPESVPRPTTVLGVGRCCTPASEAPSAPQTHTRPSTEERLQALDPSRADPLGIPPVVVPSYSAPAGLGQHLADLAKIDRLRHLNRDGYLALILRHPLATLLGALQCGDTAAWVEALEYSALPGEGVHAPHQASDVVAAWDAAGHGPDLVRGLEALRTRAFGGGK